MRINRWLWGLWLAMILSMLMRQKADTYMVVALIILPILIVLLDLHEEIATLKEENKHQRKFVMDRYNVMQERLTDVSNQIEKRLVVDFAEFAATTPHWMKRERSSYPDIQNGTARPVSSKSADARSKRLPSTSPRFHRYQSRLKNLKIKLPDFFHFIWRTVPIFLIIFI